MLADEAQEEEKTQVVVKPAEKETAEESTDEKSQGTSTTN